MQDPCPLSLHFQPPNVRKRFFQTEKHPVCQSGRAGKRWVVQRKELASGNSLGLGVLRLLGAFFVVLFFFFLVVLFSPAAQIQMGRRP